jgi:phosphomevalonate kinase
MEVNGVGHSKCLLLGGYVVLDRENTGVCISLQPKVTCTARRLSISPFSVRIETLPQSHAFVFAPADWQDPASFHSRYERFLIASLHVFFRLHATPDFAISLIVNGDPQFYTGHSKTGLGSSAATTVAVVRALSKLVLARDDDDLTFRMASIAHSLAQGNLGSGFDISCAVWGTQIFRRPSATFLAIEKIGELWDNEHRPFMIPRELKVCLVGTGIAGSDTPGLVRRFQSMAARNSGGVAALCERIDAAAAALVGGDIEAIASKFRDVRRILRTITVAWDVGIVPEEVEALASRLEACEGVLVSVIPGAGGFDALACIVVRDFGGFSALGVEVLAETE